MKTLYKVRENDSVAVEIGSLFEIAPTIYGSDAALPKNIFADGDPVLKGDEGDDDDGTPVGVIAIQKEDIGECCYPHVYRIFCDV